MLTNVDSRGRQKARQQEETNKSTDSLACTSHHWSMLKLSDMCLPFLFFPQYSNCSMDGNSKSSPEHRGWIYAFLFSITISSDRQEHTYFRGLFLGDGFYTVGCVKPCPPCCIWQADVKYKTATLKTGSSFDSLVAGYVSFSSVYGV